MKKFLCIFAVLVSAVIFTACNPLSLLNGNGSAQKVTKSDLEGIWKSDVRFADMMFAIDEEALEESADDAQKNVLDVIKTSSADVSIAFYLDFSDDSYDVYFKISEYTTAIKDFYYQLFDELSDDSERLAKFMSLTEDELDEFLQTQGMTKLSEVTDMLKANVDNMSDSDIEGFISGGSGKIKNGKYITENLDFEIDGKKVVLQEDTGSDNTVIMRLKNDKLVFDKFTDDGVNANAYIFKNGFEKVK